MEDEVFKEIQSLIKQKFNKDVELNTILSETGIDSLDLLDLVVESEEKHNIRIDDEQLLLMKTIKDVVYAIASKLIKKND